MTHWSWKVWGAILGGIIVLIAAWLGVVSALIVIVGILVGFFIGAIIDGNIAFRVSKGGRVR